MSQAQWILAAATKYSNNSYTNNELSIQTSKWYRYEDYMIHCPEPSAGKMSVVISDWYELHATSNKEVRLWEKAQTSPNTGSMSGQRLRRWSDIEPVLYHCSLSPMSSTPALETRSPHARDLTTTHTMVTSGLEMAALTMKEDKS